VNGLLYHVLTVLLSAVLVIGGGPCTNADCCLEAVHHNTPLERTHCEECTIRVDNGTASALGQGDFHHKACCCGSPHLPPALQSSVSADGLSVVSHFSTPAFACPNHTLLAIYRMAEPLPTASGSSLKSIRSTVLLI
jgi:hypothetical protein